MSMHEAAPEGHAARLLVRIRHESGALPYLLIYPNV